MLNGKEILYEHRALSSRCSKLGQGNRSANNIMQGSCALSATEKEPAKCYENPGAQMP